jgi:hypothetical protein
MWHLVMNLPWSEDQVKGLFLDETNSDDQVSIVTGSPYSNEALRNRCLTGYEPHEAVLRYSEELKVLVREWLLYYPADRISLDDLRNRIRDNIANPQDNNAPGNLVLGELDDFGEYFEGRRYGGGARQARQGEEGGMDEVDYGQSDDEPEDEDEERFNNNGEQSNDGDDLME